MPPPLLETRIRVRFAETDQMGIVYYANYLIWMEVGRVEYCRAGGIRYRDLERNDGILLTVAEANCRYISPAHYDEEVIIRTGVARAHPRMIAFGYEMVSAETGRNLAEGFTKHIFCGRDLRPCRLPEKYHAAFGISAETSD
jgi:acyl-CoA thioester hydrolase